MITWMYLTILKNNVSLLTGMPEGALSRSLSIVGAYPEFLVYSFFGMGQLWLMTLAVA
jgi:hypothetical protein